MTLGMRLRHHLQRAGPSLDHRPTFMERLVILNRHSLHGCHARSAQHQNLRTVAAPSLSHQQRSGAVASVLGS